MTSKRIRWTWALALALLSTAAWAGEFRLEKKLDLAPGGTFSLDSEAGDVTVRGGDGAQVVVTIVSNREDFAELYTLRFETPRPDRAEVVIERKSRGSLSWFGNFGSRTTVDVALPKGASAGLSSAGGRVEIASLEGNVRAESSGGRIVAKDLGADATLSASGGRVVAERIRGALDASSTGGGIEARSIGGAARLESSGGGIDAEQIAGDLEASTSGGGVDVREAHGTVDASSSGGSVSVVFAAGNARGGRVGSSGGGVSVRLDPRVDLDIDASSSGGNVDSALPVTVQGKLSRDTLRGKLNAGGALLKLRSSGGGVTLTPR